MTLQELLKDLKEKAAKATPGKRLEREDFDYYQGGTYIGVGPYRHGTKPDGTHGKIVVNPIEEKAEYFETDICRVESGEADKEFLMVTGPDTILRLCEALEKAVGAISDVVETGALERNQKYGDKEALNGVREFLEKWAHQCS